MQAAQRGGLDATVCDRQEVGTPHKEKGVADVYGFGPVLPFVDTAPVLVVAKDNGLPCVGVAPNIPRRAERPLNNIVPASAVQARFADHIVKVGP